MNVIVCVKQVIDPEAPPASFKIDAATNKATLPGVAPVIDPYGEPIPRLYAAGEFGSIWGLLYQGAANIGESMVFGRIAGKNAAAEPSR